MVDRCSADGERGRFKAIITVKAYRIPVPTNTEPSASPIAVPLRRRVEIQHEVTVGKGLHKRIIRGGEPSGVVVRCWPSREISRVHLAMRAPQVLRNRGEAITKATNGFNRRSDGPFHTLWIKRGVRGSQGRHTVEAGFTGRPHGTAVVRILREIWAQIHAGNDQLGDNTRNKTLETPVKRDDHRIARRSIEFKQMDWTSVRVKTPRVDQIFAGPKRHRFHQIDAHACC